MNCCLISSRAAWRIRPRVWEPQVDCPQDRSKISSGSDSKVATGTCIMLSRWMRGRARTRAPSVRREGGVPWGTLLPPLADPRSQPPSRGILRRWQDKRLCDTLLQQWLFPSIGQRMRLTMYERSGAVTGYLVGAGRCGTLLYLDFRNVVSEGLFPKSVSLEETVRCIRSPYALDLVEVRE